MHGDELIYHPFCLITNIGFDRANSVTLDRGFRLRAAFSSFSVIYIIVQKYIKPDLFLPHFINKLKPI